MTSDYREPAAEASGDSAHAHALELLAEHRAAGRVEGAVHLDLSCGRGQVADLLGDRFDVTYVGVDTDAASVAAVRGRGHEAHQLDLDDPAELERIDQILDGRSVASVTLVHGLEQRTDVPHTLAYLGRLLARERGVAVIVVPNVTHVDVAAKAIFGRWDDPDAGPSDRRRSSFHSAASLERALRRCALAKIAERNVVRAHSDQHFPSGHVALSDRSTVGTWLRGVRDQAEPHATTTEFVWAVTAAGPGVSDEPRADVDDQDDVFLSIIMRTQGRRIQELREAMLSLASQTVTDFEVLVVAHRTTAAEQGAVEEVIDDQPAFLRDRIRLLPLGRGERSAPLNLGLEHARGRYVSVFDDDDLVFADWVARFAEAEREHAGRILRVWTVLQDVTVTEVNGLAGVTATGPAKSCYSPHFSLFEHVTANQSPPIGFVFPRSLHTDLGLSFDESMTTMEDYDFLLRAAQLAGVTTIEQTLAVYHWWSDRPSSRTVHPASEWDANLQALFGRIDARPMLMPAGETWMMRDARVRLTEAEELSQRQQARIHHLEEMLANAEAEAAHLRLQLRPEQQRDAGPDDDSPRDEQSDPGADGAPRDGTLRRVARRVSRWRP